MFNLNIILGVLYAILLVIEMLVIKNLFRARVDYFKSVVASTEKRLQNRHHSNNNLPQKVFTGRDVLRHFMSRHPFSKCCHRHFPHRSYELLVFCTITSMMMCGNTVDRLVLAVPIAAVSDCLFVMVSVWLKFRFQQRLKNIVEEQLTKQSQQTSFTLQETMVRNEPIQMRVARQLHIKVFEYELAYVFVSMVSLMMLGQKFYELGYMPITSLTEMKLLGIVVSLQLLIIRPINLFVVGLVSTILFKTYSQDFWKRHPNFSTAVTTDYEQQHLIKLRVQLLVAESGQANQRAISDLRIDVYRPEQHTEEHMHTYPGVLLQDICNLPENLHSRKQSDLGLIISTVNNPQHQQVYIQEEKYDEQLERLSPVKIDSDNSVKFNSYTIKKECTLKFAQPSKEIREIQEFQVTNKSEYEEVDDNLNKTKKPHDTRICTSTQTAPGMLKYRDVSAPLHQIHLNSFEDPIATKPLYGNRRDSQYIIGSINDSYDENKTDNPYIIESDKSKRKSRNKCIHIIYTQQSSDYYNEESRSQSFDTHSKPPSRQDISRQEKENVPEGTFLNIKPGAKHSGQGSIHLPPIKPADLMLIRNTKNDNEEKEFVEENCERKRKRRKIAKRAQEKQDEPKEKSPYLQFLPKMLKKQETQRNHSCIIDSRQKHCDKKKRSQACSNKQGIQLQIIKKTITPEIDTVYT